MFVERAIFHLYFESSIDALSSKICFLQAVSWHGRRNNLLRHRQASCTSSSIPSQNENSTGSTVYWVCGSNAAIFPAKKKKEGKESRGTCSATAAVTSCTPSVKVPFQDAPDFPHLVLSIKIKEQSRLVILFHLSFQGNLLVLEGWFVSVTKLVDIFRFLDRYANL